LNRLSVALVLALALSACSGEAPPTPAPEGEKVVDKARGDIKPKKPKNEKIDDGWKAPDSTRDPKACAGAADPVKVDVASLKPIPLPSDAHPGLTDVSKASETAPDLYKVKFETTEGPFVVEVHREWAPIGADRFYNLVRIGYFDDVRFFRNIAGFMMQFGIDGNAEANKVWSEARIKDEPVRVGNNRGVITFAKCGRPDCRSTQVFINHGDNNGLDRQGFAGFGRVIEGMDVVDSLYDCYGEGAPRGKGPRQDLVQELGNAYLDAGWPNMSQVKTATIME
jgi:peptidyl-prolyl cis-trans isomerase A (cyclophilin A)